jgi:hypothetical protein
MRMASIKAAVDERGCSSAHVAQQTLVSSATSRGEAGVLEGNTGLETISVKAAQSVRYVARAIHDLQRLNLTTRLADAYGRSVKSVDPKLGTDCHEQTARPCHAPRAPVERHDLLLAGLGRQRGEHEHRILAHKEDALGTDASTE